jgi:hypothetical protein
MAASVFTMAGYRWLKFLVVPGAEVDFATGFESDRAVSVSLTSYCHCAPSGSLSVGSRSMGAIKRALVRDDAIFPQISVARGTLEARADL